MKWLPIFHRTTQDAVELDRLRADNTRLRAERDQFAKDRDAQRRIADRIADNYRDLEERYQGTVIVNTCLTDDLAAARKQLAAVDTDGWQAHYAAEKKRADRLQKQLDDALGLNTAGVADGRHWQTTRADRDM
ncbi:hypothetical protein [Streptomyces sp. NPDC004376]